MGKDLVGWAGSGGWNDDPVVEPPPEKKDDDSTKKKQEDEKKKPPPSKKAGPAPRSGLVLGRFDPPHLGHQHLIDFARASVQHLTVLVFARSSDPIPGTTRAAWLREMAPGVHVMVALDEPTPAVEDPDVKQRWTDLVRRYVPEGPAYFFASDDHGFRFAEHLGAVYVPVDPKRQAVPISATAIRKAPLACWKYLPVCARSWFARRVAIVGAEASGKTTLARALAARFDTVWVPEYARTLVEDRRRRFEPDEVALVERGQAASEDALARQANRLVVCDTDVMTVRLWGERLFGLSVEPGTRRYDLTLVLPSENAFRARIVAELRRLGRRFVEIGADNEDAAARAVESVLAD
jgi:NadR type nicotinamide-nucleotide adenylyltransferase